MKLIRYALALALLSSGGLFAEVGKPVHGARYKKIETAKKGATKRVAAKSAAKDRYGKPTGTYKKMEAKKHEKGLRKPTKAASTKNTDTISGTTKDRSAGTTAKKYDSITAEKIAGWLGLGATGAAATKAVSHKKYSGYHIGPRGWHHNFGPGWGDRGWVEGYNEHGHWVFAGYRPEWWQTNYPVYWKDVVGPLYRKTNEYRKTVGK